MEQNDLRDLYIEELRDLYDAENQLIKALPKMAEAATSAQLRSGFEEHLEQTRGHAQRIEEIFNELGEKAKGKKCKGMQGLVKEGEDLVGDFEGDVLDAALISAAQRVEHYEIAAYGTVRAFANILGDTEAATLLEQTLEEEKETDRKLTELGLEYQLRSSSRGRRDRRIDAKSQRKGRRSLVPNDLRLKSRFVQSHRVNRKGELQCRTNGTVRTKVSEAPPQTAATTVRKDRARAPAAAARVEAAAEVQRAAVRVAAAPTAAEAVRNPLHDAGRFGS